MLKKNIKNFYIKIDFIINDTLLGTVNPQGSSVPIVNTIIDNTTIGAGVPSTGSFTSGTIAEEPTTANGISNKKYVDNTSTALAIALGV